MLLLGPVRGDNTAAGRGVFRISVSYRLAREEFDQHCLVYIVGHTTGGMIFLDILPPPVAGDPVLMPSSDFPEQFQPLA